MKILIIMFFVMLLVFLYGCFEIAGMEDEEIEKAYRRYMESANENNR